MSDVETTVARVLAEHAYDGRPGSTCRCAAPLSEPGDGLTRTEIHRAHVAAKVAEALAGPAPDDKGSPSVGRDNPARGCEDYYCHSPFHEHETHGWPSLPNSWER